MSVEAFIQVALDGAGKQTKQLVIKGVPQPDGTVATVYVSDVAFVDQEGRRVDGPDSTNALLRAVIKELKAHNRLLAQIFEHEIVEQPPDEHAIEDGDDPVFADAR